MFPDRRGAVSLGLQAERIGTSAVFVLPNPSGRNANYSYAEMLDAYAALAKYARRTRQTDVCEESGNESGKGRGRSSDRPL